VPETLALVRVGATQLADVGRDLAHLLLVDAGHPQAGGRLDRERDALRRLDRHGVAEAQGELEVRATGLHAVTHTDDLEGLGVPLGDAGDHVGDQGAREPVQGPASPLVVRPGHLQRAVLTAGHRDRCRDGVGEGSLGALHADGLAVDGDVHATGHRNRESSDP
jgi:hypothetical protein